MFEPNYGCSWNRYGNFSALYEGDWREQHALLLSAYANALRLATSRGAHSIAVPLLGAGARGGNSRGARVRERKRAEETRHLT